MALFDFIKDVGEKLLGGRKAQAASPEGSATAPAGGGDPGEAIAQHIRGLNLAADDLRVRFDPGSGVVTLSGTVPDQATRERIVLAAGNVEGVAQVDDRMTVKEAAAAAQARFYTVQSGDTLSKIAKSMYGDASKYPAIFEANRPMLSHPDKIYPGQVLRIPGEG